MNIIKGLQEIEETRAMNGTDGKTETRVIE